MKRFRFSLEALATLRRAALERAMERYASAMTEQRRTLGRLDASRQELAQMMQGRRDLVSSAAGDWEQQHRWQQVLELKMEACRRDLVRAEDALNKEQAILFAARRDAEALDRIRQRRLSVHRQEDIRAEQKELDEMASRTSMACGLLIEEGHGKSLHHESINNSPSRAGRSIPG